MSIETSATNANSANKDDTTNTVTNNNAASNKVKHIAEEWELDKIGEFLWQLYLKQIITYRRNWHVEKHQLRLEFNKFLQDQDDPTLKAKLQKSNGTLNIGTILSHTNYLLNTVRGSSLYRIKKVSLFNYRNRRFEELDAQQRFGSSKLSAAVPEIYVFQNNASTKAVKTIQNDTGRLYVDTTLNSTFEVPKDGELFKLKYEGTDLQKINPKFCQTNMGCFICQKNFGTPEDFENHAEFHGVEGDFEYGKNLQKCDKVYFNLFYQQCTKSHYFCFSLLNVSEQSLELEKIVIILPTSMYEVHNSFLPTELASSDSYKFFADSHLFKKYVEQPILIAFKMKNQSDMRLVEEHHFLRLEDLPLMYINVNSNHLSNRSLFKRAFTLPQYKPTEEVRNVLVKSRCVQKLSDLSNDFKDYIENDKQLNMQNIRGTLNILLQVEDFDNMKNYAKLKQSNAKFLSFEGGYALKLNVNDEVHPENILCPGDEMIIVPQALEYLVLNKSQTIMDLLVKNVDDIKYDLKNQKKMQSCYFGVVESVLHQRVQFMCDKSLENVNYLVIFCPGRIPLRYQYRALELYGEMTPYNVKRTLFPEKPPKIICEQPKTDLKLINASFKDNLEQLTAIQNIAYGPRLHAPYIIFGPPGTGKTTTVVEAILQLYHRNKENKILVTAGSNSACDEVALRLIKTLESLGDSRAITRIYSRSYENHDCIDECLLDASNMYSAHFYPSVEILHEYRIIVCTLSIVGHLATGKFGRTALGNGIFTHIFIDEAGASSEAETLVGIMGIVSSNTRLILSGDHKQLGPVLGSKFAEDLGLSVSLMERLLGRDCYRVADNGTYDKSIQTRLIRNYRSHPKIVESFSSLYYDGELLPLADMSKVDLCSRWHAVPNPGFPIMFHSVFGKTERGLHSPSSCNFAELQAVLDYVKELLYFGINGEDVKQADVGIISPYKKQCELIRNELNIRNWPEIETGSVETFQGKEKRIIIVSFVRSFTSTLGFLENPRRLNVTISRPKDLLILIGNPKTLSLNADFKYIIDLCENNASMVGSVVLKDEELKRRANDTSQNLSKSMEKLNIKNGGYANRQENQFLNDLNGKNLREKYFPRKNIDENKKSGKTDNDNKLQSATNTNSNKLGRNMKNNGKWKSRQEQRKNAKKFTNLNVNSQNKEEILTDSIALTKSSSVATDLEEFLQSMPDVPIDKSYKSGKPECVANSNMKVQSELKGKLTTSSSAKETNYDESQYFFNGMIYSYPASNNNTKNDSTVKSTSYYATTSRSRESAFSKNTLPHSSHLSTKQPSKMSTLTSVVKTAPRTLTNVQTGRNQAVAAAPTRSSISSPLMSLPSHRSKSLAESSSLKVLDNSTNLSSWVEPNSIQIFTDLRSSNNMFYRDIQPEMAAPITITRNNQSSLFNNMSATSNSATPKAAYENTQKNKKECRIL